ncbi:MAG: cbb3-type cytochrome c oxidase subunit 3 [Rhodospirillales bacterium]|nr:cbb3-type cytochrome c oxidase subunit 3 [Rhodospirillales bacterium]
MDLTALLEIARSAWVVWLMILFGGIVFWAFRPKNKKRFEDDGMIPFRDEENGG